MAERISLIPHAGPTKVVHDDDGINWGQAAKMYSLKIMPYLVCMLFSLELYRARKKNKHVCYKRSTWIMKSLRRTHTCANKERACCQAENNEIRNMLVFSTQLFPFSWGSKHILGCSLKTIIRETIIQFQRRSWLYYGWARIKVRLTIAPQHSSFTTPFPLSHLQSSSWANEQGS